MKRGGKLAFAKITLRPILYTAWVECAWTGCRAPFGRTVQTKGRMIGYLFAAGWRFVEGHGWVCNTCMELRGYQNTNSRWAAFCALVDSGAAAVMTDAQLARKLKMHVETIQVWRTQEMEQRADEQNDRESKYRGAGPRRSRYRVKSSADRGIHGVHHIEGKDRGSGSGIGSAEGDSLPVAKDQLVEGDVPDSCNEPDAGHSHESA